jgi:hypothetical protein
MPLLYGRGCFSLTAGLKLNPKDPTHPPSPFFDEAVAIRPEQCFRPANPIFVILKQTLPPPINFIKNPNNSCPTFDITHKKIPSSFRPGIEETFYHPKEKRQDLAASLTCSIYFV